MSRFKDRFGDEGGEGGGGSLSSAIGHSGYSTAEDFIPANVSSETDGLDVEYDTADQPAVGTSGDPA